MAGVVEELGRVNEPAVDSAVFLAVEDLSMTFESPSRSGGESLTVLDGLDLTVAPGEFVTIIGPSGCGKTTLLNCVAGLTSPTGGRMTLDGNELRGPGPDRAVVFQQASLLPWRTVTRNVAYGLELRRELRRSEIRERVQRAIELVGLDGFEHHYPHQISGGMQQRVNLARALVVEPKLVLMDEPFGALDALTRELLQDELAALAQTVQRATLFVTHDIEEAVFLGDRVVAMSRAPGRIIADIRVSFDRPRSRDVGDLPEFKEIVKELRRLLRPVTADVDATTKED
jgi:NitT/TauT family transport system ATP-binding protein